MTFKTILTAHIFVFYSAFSWGFEAHREINHQAVFALPKPLFGFYKLHISIITQKATNPDMRRYILENEAHKHYIDLDHYTDHKFIQSKPTWAEALNKYPEDTLNEHGTLPWNLFVLKKSLTKAFEEKNFEKIVRLSADIGHYLADAHVPLHTTQNYNGQLTNQHGIHGLWETRIVHLKRKNYNYWNIYGNYVKNWQDETWKIVLHSNSLVDSVLKMERATSLHFTESKKYEISVYNNKNIKTYSRAFVDAYDLSMHAMVERQLKKSIIAVASFWYSCWVDAGKPSLPTAKEKEINQLIEEDKKLKNEIKNKKLKNDNCKEHE